MYKYSYIQRPLRRHVWQSSALQTREFICKYSGSLHQLKRSRRRCQRRRRHYCSNRQLQTKLKFRKFSVNLKTFSSLDVLKLSTTVIPEILLLGRSYVCIHFRKRFSKDISMRYICIYSFIKMHSTCLERTCFIAK